MWAYVAAVAASSVMGAAGARRSADAQVSASNYQAQVAENDAVAMENNADYAIRAGGVKAGEQSMKGAAQLGRVRAAISANGVDVNSGSPVDVQESQAEQNKLDVDTIIHNANLESQGYRSKASSFRAQAALDRAQAENADEAGDFGVAQSLIGGATSIAGGYALRGYGGSFGGASGGYNDALGLNSVSVPGGSGAWVNPG